jgi:AcrR family transcriptional regulator
MRHMQASTAEPGTSRSTPGGRPRSESSRLSLLKTAYSLMKKLPINEISTQEIANKAGVSTATVYRWWPTKQALLLDAFLHVKDKQVEFPETGSPLERIRTHVVSAGKFMGGNDGRVAARIIAAIQDDDFLRKGFTEKLYLPHSTRLLRVAEEAIKAGELPPGTDAKALLDTVFGTCLVRILVRHEQVRKADVEAAFDFAVAGAWGYWHMASKPPKPAASAR